MKKILSLFLCLAVLVSCFCFTTVSAANTIKTDKTEYLAGETIWTTATGTGWDWVGLYLANDPTDGSVTSIYWYYITDYKSGDAIDIKAQTAGDRGSLNAVPAGDYKVVVFSDGGYNVTATTYFKVVPADSTNTVYDMKLNGQSVADGDVVTINYGQSINLQPTITGGAAGEAWIGLYHAYYNKNTPFANASGNMGENWAYVSQYAGKNWDITGTIWSGRTTVVLFGDGGYDKIVKLFYIQFNGFREADFDFNGKAIENDAKVTLYKGEKAVLNMRVGSSSVYSHGDPWYKVFNGISGSSTIDYSGYGNSGWVYVSNGDHDITSKLKTGLNTVVVFGNEQYNDIRKCIVIDYKDFDISVSVNTLDKASVRLNRKGLRFYTQVDTAKIASLKDNGMTVEAGTLIGPADKNTEELTLNLVDGKKVVDVKFDLDNKDGYYTDGDFTGIVGSLTNIKDGNIGRDFVARGYVKVTVNGNTTVFYSSTQTTRSLKQVAQAVKADTSYYNSLTAYFKSNIDAWAK